MRAPTYVCKAGRVRKPSCKVQCLSSGLWPLLTSSVLNFTRALMKYHVAKTTLYAYNHSIDLIKSPVTASLLVAMNNALA